jgi:regulatory protein
VPLPPPSLKGRALRLLSGREYSRTELERKLKPHEESPGLLAKALDELQAKGFISEQRVLDSVIHRRSDKLGAARIRQELQNKGLDPDAIKAAINALQATEFERAEVIWRRKFGATSAFANADADAQAPPGATERGKQISFLMARGFGSDTIRRVIAAGSGGQASSFEE